MVGATSDYSTIRFPLTQGDLKDFPRPSPQDQAAQQGFAILRGSTEQAIAVLYALAAALDNNLPVSPALLRSVQPYIAAFQEELSRPTAAESNQSAEDKVQPASGD
jgi:hypothetical protein